MNKEELEEILKRSDDAKKGINLSPTFNTAKEAIEYLHSNT